VHLVIVGPPLGPEEDKGIERVSKLKNGLFDIAKKRSLHVIRFKPHWTVNVMD
jgi:hypothetical protein